PRPRAERRRSLGSGPENVREPLGQLAAVVEQAADSLRLILHGAPRRASWAARREILAGPLAGYAAFSGAIGTALRRLLAAAEHAGASPSGAAFDAGYQMLYGDV